MEKTKQKSSAGNGRWDGGVMVSGSAGSEKTLELQPLLGTPPP